MVTRACLKSDDFIKYQTGKNEAWRRLSRNLDFSYISTPTTQPIISGKKAYGFSQGNKPVGVYYWPCEFLYQSLSEKQQLEVVLENGEYTWQNKIDKNTAQRYQITIPKGHKVILSETLSISGLRSVDIIIEPGAQLVHLQQIMAPDESFDHINITVKEGGLYHQVYAQLACKSHRRAQRVLLVEPESAATIEGVCIAQAKQSIREHVAFEHLAKNTRSKHNVSSVLDQAMIDIFSTVNIGMQGKNAVSRQKIEHLLLSETGRAFSKPALNVAIDDVDCQHGATMGMLDPLVLFYLQSRGLSLSQARSLYLKGYIEKCFSAYPEQSQYLIAHLKAIGQLYE